MRALRRALEPPAPFLHNPRAPSDFPLGRWNLYIGGAHRTVPGYVSLDLFFTPGVDILADAEALPFPDVIFTRVECDAVLEHVRRPERVMREIARVLARSEEHTSELQSPDHLVCRLLLEKKNQTRHSGSTRRSPPVRCIGP